ncbi:MAG: hypothetical protein WCK67_05595 [bacterium]
MSLNFADFINDNDTQKDLAMMNSYKSEPKAKVEEAPKPVEKTEKPKTASSLLKEIEKLKEQQQEENKIKPPQPDIYNFEIEKSFDLEKNNLSDKDLDFFNFIVQNPNITIMDMSKQFNNVNFIVNNQSGNISYKSFDFSKSLSSLIEYAFTKQKPVRLDFEGQSSVIIKIDKEGKLTAEFMSADKAMEQILRNTIPNLKSKFEAEGLPYKDISYKDNSSNRQKSRKEQDEENNNEES